MSGDANRRGEHRAGANRAGVRRWGPLGRRWWGLIFVLPVVAISPLFSIFPVLFGFTLSLTDYDLLDPAGLGRLR